MPLEHHKHEDIHAGQEFLGSSHIRQRQLENDENVQPAAGSRETSDYGNGRQLSRGPSRRHDDGARSQQYLHENFLRLEQDLIKLNLNRRNSLTGRNSLQLPLTQSHQQECVKPQATERPDLDGSVGAPPQHRLQPQGQQQQVPIPRSPIPVLHQVRQLQAASLQRLASPEQQQQQQQQQQQSQRVSTHPLRPRDAAPNAAEDHTSTTRPTTEPNNHDHIIKFPRTPSDESVLLKAAKGLFDDEKLLSACELGLNMTLTRTRDGATTETRLQELAELVKILRRCLKDVAKRTETYIEQAANSEKEKDVQHAEELERAKRAEQTLRAEHAAELATVRQRIAEVERESREEKAKVGTDLDAQMEENSRMLREIARLTEERDLARDEFKAAEQQRHQLLSDLMSLERTNTQQARELAAYTVNQSEAIRVLAQGKNAAEELAAAFKEESDRHQKNLAAAQFAIAELEKENHSLRTVKSINETELASRTAVVDMQNQRVMELEATLKARTEELSQAKANIQHMERELSEASDRCSQLKGALAERRDEVNAMHTAWKAQETKMLQDFAAWEQERNRLSAKLSVARGNADQLSHEKALLRAALEEALEKKGALERLLEAESQEKASLRRELLDFQNQLTSTEARATQLEKEAAAMQQRLQAELERLAAELEAGRQTLAEKDTRLVTLESEFTALKEVLGETGAEGNSKDIVTTLLSKIANLQNAAAAAEAVRRKLHNELVDIKGNIRVYCRVRPHLTPATLLDTSKGTIALQVDGQRHSFAYDRVFDGDSTQEEVFSAVSELVQSALDGYHVCIFSYGQTGAGKTHTMQGGKADKAWGIIPRAVKKILEAAAKLRDDAEWEYVMEASFIEVYNETLRDLLNKGADIKDINPIKHDPSGGHTVVSGARVEPVDNMERAKELIEEAGRARATDATAMNAVSSRSHCVFMLRITGRHAATNTQLQGSLCLVDLAGSERLDRSLAEGAAKKEACAINASLSALGGVFSALSAKTAHVPYRDSKLTYLLQPCLGGSGKTLMFVNINPDPTSTGESLCSLRFAAKVNGCETGAKGGARRNVQTLGGGGGAFGSAGDLRLPRGFGSLPASSVGSPERPPQFHPGVAGPGGPRLPTASSRSASANGRAAACRPGAAGLAGGRPVVASVGGALHAGTTRRSLSALPSAPSTITAASRRMSTIPQSSTSSSRALLGAGSKGQSSIGVKRPGVLNPGNIPKKSKP